MGTTRFWTRLRSSVKCIGTRHPAVVIGDTPRAAGAKLKALEVGDQHAAEKRNELRIDSIPARRAALRSCGLQATLPPAVEVGVFK